MFNDFLISFKLKNTYRVNSIIFSIKQLPIIKKMLPNELYKSKGLKIFANIISSLIEVISTFLGKLLYIFIMIFLALNLYKEVNYAYLFIHIFVFLTICGGFCNTYMFNPTKDKYYAIFLMKMDAKNYVLSNYNYSLLKVLIGFLPFTIIFSIFVGLPLWVGILMPIFVIMIKNIFNSCALIDYKRSGRVKNENNATKSYWIGIVSFLLLAYGLPLLVIPINLIIFIILFIVTLILGIGSYLYIYRFQEYRQIYKSVLTPNNIFILENQKQMTQDNSLNKIEFDTLDSSNKKGYAYFHDIFVKRHKKILTKSAKKTTFISTIIIVLILLATIIKPEIKQNINRVILTYLPYFVFIMYIINRGQVVTQAMFMNCDHSMLSYRFYKSPNAILGLFKERLKTLIKVNLMPAFVIAIGLAVLLYATGGTDNSLNYLIVILSILSMSIFFSVHYLVMYYLLQPYNVNIEMKSSTYSIVQTVTYFLVYFMIDLRLPTFYFGIAAIIFCILYSFISLFLAYRIAPNTFKLRL